MERVLPLVASTTKECNDQVVASLSGDQLDCPLGITVDQRQSALTTHRHPFSDHHKISGKTGLLDYLQLLSGPDQVQ